MKKILLQFEVSRHSNVLLVPTAALRWRPAPRQVAEDARDDFVQALRRPSGASDDPPSTAPAKEPHDQGTVWVEDHGFVRPVHVRVGLSDGLRTEVTGGGLKEGDAVVVGESSPDSTSGMSNPFAPELFDGKKQ